MLADASTLEALRQSVAEDSLHEFMRQAWPVIEPGKAFQDNWHLRVICEQLERVTRREIRRLIINVPPRSTKSTIVSVLWPVWTWLQDPSHQWLTVSHAADLAIRDALKSRRLMQSPWFQARWGRLVRLTGDQNQKSRYENDRRGYRIAMSMGAGITGEGADTLVIDDPHDRNAAHSELERTTGLTTFDESLSTRLNDPATGAIVVIMQRLHVNDLTGHLLSGQEPWVHLCLPMEFEPDVRCPLDQRTVPGEPLWPARFTPAVVAALKARLGPYGAAGQLQQRPSPRGGGVWPIEKFQTYKSDPGPMEQYVQSWDFAFKKTEDGSFVVGQVWGKRGAGFYLLDQMRFRGGFNAMCGAVLQLSAKWPAALTKLVEPKANGEAVLDSLRQHVAGLVPVEVEGSKEARAEAVSPAIYAGNVFLPDKAIAPWVTEFVGEVEAFPNGAHDDQVDAASQALKHLTGSGHGMFDAAQFAAAFLSD